jgi:hypothetical protein
VRALKEASTLLSAPRGRMRKSRLERGRRGANLIGRVVESKLSREVVSKDQQAFLWEHQKNDPLQQPALISFNEGTIMGMI